MSPIANYSTTVTALKSIGEIQGMEVGEKGKTLYEVMRDHRFQLPQGKGDTG
jgi:hypothetical protein